MASLKSVTINNKQYEIPQVDDTLTKSGMAADSKKVGEQFSSLSREIASITLGQHTDGLVYIFIGGVPIGNGLSITSGTVVEPVYGQTVIDNAVVTMTQNQTAQLGIKLSEEPTQNQTITISCDSSILSFDKTSLEFTTDNWNEFQYVTVSTTSFDEDTMGYVVLTNSDKLLTESTIIINLQADAYSVDTTIPTDGQHIVTVDDFEKTSVYGDYIRLNGYKAEYENIVIPSSLDGKIPWLTISPGAHTTSNSTFGYGNTTIKYVTFEDGVVYRGGGVTTGCDASELFKNCTNLIGVSNMNVATTNLAGAFAGCTNLKFVDNLGDLINVTTLFNAFENSGIEYLPDLSKLTKINGTSNDKGYSKAFYKMPSLKKIYGMPNALEGTATGINMYSTSPSLEYAKVPSGITTLSFAFYNCTSLRKVEIYDDNLTSSQIFSANTFVGCSNLEVYCNEGTTTHNTLLELYGSSTAITIKTFGSDGTMPSIVVWGDSISSPNKGWYEWPARLQDKLGTDEYLVKNEAIAGEWSTSTTTRQGGNTMTVGAFTIPSDTSSVQVTLTDLNGSVYGSSPVFSCSGTFNPCIISGVEGVITQAGTSPQTYNFTRLSSGDSVEVADGTTVTSKADDKFNNADNVMIFYLNGNAGWNDNADDLLEFFQMAVNHFIEKGGTKYIVSGPATGVAMRTDTLRQTVLEFETKAQQTFGEHWFNLREYEIANGLTQNGLTASALDNERIALGQVPASLIGGGDTETILMYDGNTVTDDSHPNAYGSNTIMLGFYEKGVALGYWS